MENNEIFDEILLSESVKINDSSNCLDKCNYLFNPKLSKSLISGSNMEKDRRIYKDKPAAYFVVFRSVNIKGKNVVYYNYISYHDIFSRLLLHYIKYGSSSLICTDGHLLSSNYMYVLDISSIVSNRNVIRYLLGDNVNSFTSRMTDLDPYLDTVGITDLFKFLLKGCPIILSTKALYRFFFVCVNRDIKDILYILSNFNPIFKDDKHDEISKFLIYRFNYVNFVNYNFLGRIIFITTNLNNLVNLLSSCCKGGINQGPQKWRGQSNSLSNTIESIDNDIRISMNNHHQYHFNKGNVPNNKFIGKSKFSYQNIHINLGYVRW